MSTTYSIQVYNYSGAPRNYLLFQTVPVPDGQPDVYANVYQSSGQIASGNDSQVTFEMTDEFFAVLGTNPTPLADKVKVTTGSAASVTLSSGETPPEQPGTLCVDHLERRVSQLGEPNIFIGMGARGPSTQGIVPVATVPASPSYDFYFQPIVKYYIGTGEYEPETVVNITEIGPVLDVDFTQLPGTSVTYTQGRDNHYTQGPPPDSEAAKGHKKK
ncbi:uncharacterized protein NFIA_106930 [Aspergillus fischeri NRRL 181]|uniref:Uncharacterized protein n=1 Tax=Neosartorya fischeri (strain ATCC 1020 / DSM 3700 / CBS 544.65 / FGSC A1164 / JCM 1740 / NRRL 181 / WB 181) TaxID=331117 RepID=A1CX51_NEOFI|nr:conserved hypothetical protein [Aspergillus fischeri NRRL 181]EAW25203.1 conserved hypothetical protein [Aspergillus fischeri NRRL 181]KAG2027005.1 hypothetical protein GB937_000741 [Aspergillus fischeri]